MINFSQPEPTFFDFGPIAKINASGRCAPFGVVKNCPVV
jgi:hypothetical protein